MSGECDECGEHTTDCRVNMTMQTLDPYTVQIWAQMFFDDGSVTEGLRIPAIWLEKEYEFAIDKTAQRLLESVNREEGWMLLWGAGNIQFKHYPTSFLKESDSSDVQP